MEEQKKQENNGQKRPNHHHRRRRRPPHKNEGAEKNMPQGEARRPEREHNKPKKTPIVAESESVAEACEEIIQEEPASAFPPPADVLESPIMSAPHEQKSEVMVDVVGIRFKVGGKTYYFAPGNVQVTKGAYAIVETARGLEYGEVTLANTSVSESDVVQPLRPVIRMATEADHRHQEENHQREKMAFRTCEERIEAHNLDMKLIDAQYTFDNSKLLFYFTSAGRVDFRELVKDLASVFRTRIELRQIGIRDEAKLLGGLGLCGRPLCCSVFLTDFGQVSIKMAKEQNLSLNSAKISGACGRLMCCLRFEHDTYEYEIKQSPPVDALVKTPDGNGVVAEISPLAGTAKVRLLDKPDNPPVSYHRDNLTVLQTKYKKENTPHDKNEKK